MVELVNKTELEKNYLSTTYSVFIKKEKFDIHIEQALPKKIQQLINKDKSAAILTAWNPGSQPLSESENNLRNNQLKLRIEDYSSFKALGQGQDKSWPAEESFFIVGIKKTELEKLAVEFEQYAYVYCVINKPASLIFTEHWCV